MVGSGHDGCSYLRRSAARIASSRRSSRSDAVSAVLLLRTCDMDVDMCAGACADMLANIRIDTYVDMCIDLCVDICSHSESAAPADCCTVSGLKM